MDEPTLGSRRILLVEDADDIRDAFAMLLRAEGAEVVVAQNGRAAADAVRRDDFDIVLMDFGLPDVPGDVLIRRILERVRHRPRVVVVTGYDEPYVTRARQAGADLVLNKPVPWPRLMNVLRDGVDTESLQGARAD